MKNSAITILVLITLLAFNSVNAIRSKERPGLLPII